MAKRIPLKDRIKRFTEEYEYSFRADYSGRYMYGSTCVGVVGPRDMDIDLLEFLVDDGMSVSRAKAIVKSAKWDNMGLKYIMYFPGTK